MILEQPSDTIVARGEPATLNCKVVMVTMMMLLVVLVMMVLLVMAISMMIMMVLSSGVR